MNDGIPQGPDRVLPLVVGEQEENVGLLPGEPGIGHGERGRPQPDLLKKVPSAYFTQGHGHTPVRLSKA